MEEGSTCWRGGRYRYSLLFSGCSSIQSTAVPPNSSIKAPLFTCIRVYILSNVYLTWLIYLIILLKGTKHSHIHSVVNHPSFYAMKHISFNKKNKMKNKVWTEGELCFAYLNIVYSCFFCLRSWFGLCCLPRGPCSAARLCILVHYVLPHALHAGDRYTGKVTHRHEQGIKWYMSTSTCLIPSLLLPHSLGTWRASLRPCWMSFHSSG